MYYKHGNFDNSQSMHMYRDTLYYKDSTNLSAGNFDLQSEDWAAEGWEVKYTADKVDRIS